MQKALIFLLLVHLFYIKLSGQNPRYPTITIEASRISVGELMEEISRQSGLEFSFNSRLIDAEETISFTIRDARLEACMDLFTQKTNLRYSIVEGQIVLNRQRKKGAGTRFILSGFLSDRSSGESLIGAVVHAVGTSFGTFTNEFGYYALSLTPGKYKIAYSHVGYEKSEREIELEKPVRRNVSIPPVSFELAEVTIAPPLADILTKKQLGEMELAPEELNNMPEFAGESGLVRGLQSLPGLKADGDGSAYFYARGGERDQNLIIIDDAPIYNPSHLFGFYSMVIPDFAKSIRIYKSGMPASMGDRLSSIVSIRTRDGNLNNYELSGAITPFVSRIAFETPIKKKKSALFLSVRNSNLDWLYKRDNPGSDINFRDFHMKWNRILNKNNRVFLTVISSTDLSKSNEQNQGAGSGIQRDNFAATLRWNHLFNPKLFLNTIIYTGAYGNRLFLNTNSWKSELGMLGFKTDFTHYARPDLHSRFGLEVQGYFTNPGSLAVDSSLSFLPNLSPNYSRKTVLYYQSDWDINEKLSLHAGLRLINWARFGPDTYYNFDAQYEVEDTVKYGLGVYNRFINADPRISLQYQIDKTSQIKLSFGSYHQYLQLINNSISPFTALEVWLPAGPNIWPQSSQQWSFGYHKHLAKSQLDISVAAYHKKMQGQIDYEPHASTYLNPLIEGELRFGTNRSYGLEFLLKRSQGRLNGWLAYTYSRSFRKTFGLNEGREYRAIQDRPHEFSLFLNYQLSRRTFLSGYWTSYSGATFSSPTGFINFQDQQVPIFGERNNDRLPSYRRMDGSIQFLLNKKKEAKYQHSLTFSMHNMLGRKNAYVVKFNKIPASNSPFAVRSNVLDGQPLSPSQVSLGRFLPSVSYRFKL